MKCNVPRWSESNLCTFCCGLERDEHLFDFPRYNDIHKNDWNIKLLIMLAKELGAFIESRAGVYNIS